MQLQLLATRIEQLVIVRNSRGAPVSSALHEIIAALQASRLCDADFYSWVRHGGRALLKILNPNGEPRIHRGPSMPSPDPQRTPQDPPLYQLE